MILRKSKLFSIVICIITVLSVLSLMVPKGTYAEENNKSITLVCVSGDTILAGLEWKIYKVGQRTADGQNFVQTGDFSGIQINLRRMTEDSINKAAASFQAFAIASGIKPVQQGVTNANGEVRFTGLSSGLYLISGKLLKIDSNYYVPTTTFIEIKENDNDLKYDAYPKFEYQVKAGHPVAHVVFKEWEGDEEHLNERPDHIVVDIYRNEEYYESVILNEENHWRHRWIDDDGSSSWIVMERDLPACYEMFIEYDTNYRILNSYTDEPFTTTTKISTGTASTTTTTAHTSITVGNASTTAGTTTNTTVHTSITVGQASTTAVTTTTDTVGNGTASRTRTTNGTETVTTTNTLQSGTASRTTTGTGTVTTTDTVGNGTASRTRTTDATETGTATTTTVTVEGGAATKTDNTSTNQDNATATTTKSSGETGTATETTGGNGGGNATTTKNPSGGSGSGSGGGNSGGGSSGGGSVKLPQTGQLWWPVVPLSISGVLCLSAGLVIRTRRKSDD